MSIFGYPPDGVSFTLSAGEGVTITFSDNTYTVSATGSNADASYITYNDETGTFPNSSRLAAGNNVTFDNTGGVFTINAAATGGGAPTTLSYVTTNSEASLSGERVLTEAYGVSIIDNTTTVDVGLSPTFLALPFVTIGNQAGLTGERSLAVSTGLGLADGGANSNVTLTNTASSFGRVLVDGATSINAYLLQDQFGISAGSNIVLSVSGSTIQISATDSGDANQNAFGTVAVSGQNSLVSNDPEDTLNITSGEGITLTTDDSTDTLTITNAASAFNTIQVSGQPDVVADALADTLTFVAGSNVTITTSGDSITISATDTTNPDQNLFETISVSGQSDIVADSTTDTLTFAAGDGVQITTNPSTDTLTITNTASSFNQIVVSGQSDIVASQILNSFEVAAGTGITLTTSGSTLTIENSSPNVAQNVFTTFAVSGQNDVIADSSTDTLTLVAGEGINITTDDTTDSITLSNSSSGFNRILVSGQSDVVASGLHNSLEFVAGTNVTLTTSGTSITINATGGGDAPADAEYLVLSTNGTLTDERVLTPGTGLTLVDGGAGNSATLSNTASSFGKVVVVGESDIDAHYLQDQFALEAGSNVTLTVTGSTINIASVGSSGGGGGAPTDAEYVVLSTDGTLTEERVLAVGTGLDLTDSGAGNNVTLSNTASGFNQIVVSGQSDIVATQLANSFEVIAGDNIILTTSGTSMTIASPYASGERNENSFSKVAVSGQSDIDADTTTDTLNVAAGTGIDITTNAGSDTLTIANSASSFNTITVSGQSDVVADAVQDTLTFVAGSNMTITTSGDSITFTSTDTGDVNQNAFTTISVSGQSDVVADDPTDTLTLVNGEGVEITTNAGSDSITITNAASSFGTVVVDGSPINSTLLQGQFGLTAGSNVTLTPSGTSIEIAATDTGEANQNAFSNIATTGWPTASADSTTDTLVIEGSGGIFIGIDSSTDTVTISGTGLQPLDSTLTSLAGYDTNGLIVQTSTDNFAGRSITSGTGISVSNGDGVSGNPTIANTASGFGTVVIDNTTNIDSYSLQGSFGLNAGSNITLTPSATGVTIASSGGSGSASKNITGGRLSLTSATPVTTSDVTAATTLYYTEHTSNEISLYSGSAWEVVTFSNISISLSGLTANTNYDVFVYNNSGTATLELTAWTNDTTRATSLGRQDGVYVRSGATTRRYLGTIRITSTTGQCEDSTARRFVYNQYNKINRNLSCTDGTDSWTYGSTTWRPFRNISTVGTGSVVCVIGQTDSEIDITVYGHHRRNTTEDVAYVGIGVNSSSSNSAQINAGANDTTDAHMPMVASFRGYGQEGLNTFYPIESATGNSTFHGDNGDSQLSTGLVAFVRM